MRPNSPCPELDAWLEEGQHRARVERSLGRLGRRARLRKALIEQYGGVKIPREVRGAAKGFMGGLRLSMWWTAPDAWLRLAGGQGQTVAKHKGVSVTPQIEWEKMDLKDGVLKLILALKGDPSEEEVAMILKDQFDLKPPRKVRKAAEGLMEELSLQIWWATPNVWMWPENEEGFDITRDFLDMDGNTTVTPLMLWRMGQKNDVVDLLMAMKGDPYEQVIEALDKGKRSVRMDG